MLPYRYCAFSNVLSELSLLECYTLHAFPKWGLYTTIPLLYVLPAVSKDLVQFTCL